MKRIGDLTGPEVLVSIGGILAAIGAFLPWATLSTGLGTFSVGGMDVTGGDAIAVLLVGVAVAIPNAWLPWKAPSPRWGAVAGIILVGLAIFEAGNLRPTGSATSLSIGAGLWVVGIGGALAVLGSVGQRRAGAH